MSGNMKIQPTINNLDTFYLVTFHFVIVIGIHSIDISNEQTEASSDTHGSDCNENMQLYCM